MAQNQVQGGFNGQEEFIQALKAQNGVGNQSSVFGQQQNLADILSQQAQGGGPNPALAQLANTTGQNINSQAALMAGQRGLNSNPGLAAQLIGQQGANLQQQAGGQAAVLRAQQMLAAQGALQNQQGMMGSLASQQVGQQGANINALNSGMLTNQGQLLNMQANMNSVNSGMAQQNAKSQQGLLGGIGGALGTAIAGPLSGGGSAAPNNFASNGIAGPVAPNLLPDRMMAQGGVVPRGTMMNWANSRNMKSGGKVPGKANVAGDSPKNDTVPARLSPGEVVIPRSKVDDPEKTAAFINAILGMKLRSA